MVNNKGETMKITQPDVIKKGERELMDSIIADLDWANIEKIFKEKHKIAIEDDIEYTKGDIVIHNNTVAYELNFEVKLILSLLCDRNGSYLAVKTSLDTDELQNDIINLVDNQKEEKEIIDDSNLSENDKIGEIFLEEVEYNKDKLIEKEKIDEKVTDDKKITDEIVDEKSSDEIISDETVDEISSDEIILDEIVDEKSSDEILSEEIFDEKSSDEIISDETVDEISSDEIISDETVDEKSSDEIISDETVDEISSDEIITDDEKSSDEIISDETVDEISSDEILSDEIVDEKSPDELLSDEIVDEKSSDEILSDEIVDYKSSDEIVDEKSSDEIISDETLDEKSSDEIISDEQEEQNKGGIKEQKTESLDQKNYDSNAEINDIEDNRTYVDNDIELEKEEVEKIKEIEETYQIISDWTKALEENEMSVSVSKNENPFDRISQLADQINNIEEIV